jgi:hypothetical protein
VDVKHAVRAMAFIRAAFGLALSIKTLPMLRAIDRRGEPRGDLVLWARTVGIRDFVLGSGTLLASYQTRSEARRWQTACLVSDTADTIAAALSARLVGPGRAAAATVVPLPFVAGGVWALLRLPRPD